MTTKLRDPSPPTPPETTPGPSPVQVVAPTRTDASAAPTTGADELASGRIEIDGLNVYYGAFRAVRDVSLTVQPHAITAIIGPSGCGKTTFLRTLNRMHELTPETRVEGSVRLDGEDIYGPAIDPVALRRVVGMVFQRPNPFPTMSIYDNVVAGLRLTGRPKTSSSTRWSSDASGGPRCGTRSRTSSARAARRCRVASSSGCASPGRSRSTPRSS